MGAGLQPCHVEILVGRRGELDKAVDPWPHPFKATGAHMVGKQGTAKACLPGLRRCKVPRLLLSDLVQGVMVWHLWLIPSSVQITQKS